ncbi:type II secretion system GspH family protein [Dehalococcoidia bacterium]|nr:type II secretion system GspH family protein [Dehalococcoidia bacterium]
MRGRENGLTLVEILIALTIGVMFMAMLVPAIQLMMRLAPRQANELAVEHDLDLARRWLIRDGQVSRSFTTLPRPGYGWFEWSDHTGRSPVKYQVTYYHDDASLIREERRDGTVESTFIVARNILTWDDVEFEAGAGVIIVEITSTAGKVSRSAEIIIARR